MSLDLPPDEAPLTSVDALVDFFRGAERPVAEHQIGLEHEKLIYPVGSAEPVAYEGTKGIGALFGRLASHGYRAYREAPDSPVIALQGDTSTISLEPGGQFELSGTPARTARAGHRENLRHVREVGQAARELGLQLVALGYRPFGTPASMPWMPKSRYVAMRQTLGARGKLALDMMLMTATGQVSLDWSSEADCSRKVCLTARATPLIVALFANSPLVNGADSGYRSFRSHVWTDVDPSRCGYLPSMIDGTFSYRAYVDWALAAPLLFLRREGRYLMPKITFGQLLAEGHDGKPARQADWTDHLSTLFPEVRIKRVMEVRGADCVSSAMTGGLAALMRGTLYSPAALDEADRLLPRLSFQAHQEWAEAAR
ncbi:MAG TPA: glutamate-cysteine ligase family protein, partial [Myxococcaceae bacterium]|nr:glutamate-cysteine ligase family protein [Myxococcaceae bacterium]